MELCRGLIYEVCSQKEFNLVVMKVTNVAPSSILQVMGDSNIILEWANQLDNLNVLNLHWWK